jgi:signal transduction histidine kinase
MEFILKIAAASGIIKLLRKSLDTAERLPQWDKVLSKIWAVSLVLLFIEYITHTGLLNAVYWKFIYLILLFTVYLLKDYRPARLFSLALIPLAIVSAVNHFFKFLLPDFFHDNLSLFTSAESFSTLWLLGFGIYAFIQNNKEQKQRKQEEARLQLAESRKAELEHLVLQRTTQLTAQTTELEQALTELKSTQSQLIQREKMASLGELTAGIAHEIQNPLNFVNNFAEIGNELMEELEEALKKGDTEEVQALATDIKQNLTKINHHGKRASSIVRGMLGHVRSGTTQKEPTDLNALADECLRLSFHGLRVKDRTFNAEFVMQPAENLPLLPVISQDLGRVLLNLCNNAFYAVHQKKKKLTENKSTEAYTPQVTVSTAKTPKGIEIKVQDNGIGIPEALKNKIFQPFFTTKPTGEGTGLGLSLSYDILVKGHDATLDVESTEGVGTTFKILLPLPKQLHKSE